jgi:hypothetical protein
VATPLTHGPATEVEGTFRVNGSNKRMRDLQAEFEAAPRVRTHRTISCSNRNGSLLTQYGKSLDWKKESYTTHDVASVFRRYLTRMPVCSLVECLRVCPDVIFSA